MIPFLPTLIQSLKQNTVFLISLIVAIMALTVTAQRANQTEYQRISAKIAAARASVKQVLLALE